MGYMKKNLIAMMLSIAMTVGSIGGASAFAAESTAVEASEIIREEVVSESETAEENEEADIDVVTEGVSEEEPAQVGEEAEEKEPDYESEEVIDSQEDASETADTSETMDDEIEAEEIPDITDMPVETVESAETDIIEEEVITEDENKAMAADVWLWPFPTSNTQNRGYSSNHQGVDIGANIGDPIYAVNDGTIYKKYEGCGQYGAYASGGTPCKDAGRCSPNHGYYSGYCNNGYGNGICLKTNDGYYVQFAHMQSVNSSLYEGQYVTKGTLLGYVGGSGMATGKHCHYAVATGGEFSGFVNPMNMSYTYDYNAPPKVHDTLPVDLGADFYAYIRNQSENVYLTNQKHNIGGEAFTGGSTQIWRFQRQSNGAYSIISVNDNSCVDVQGVSTENGANVYAYNGGYAGGGNQQFYIYSAYGAYYLSPVHMKGTHMLDMSLTTHNLEMWGVGADWAPQEFDIFIIPKVHDTFPIDLGADFYAYFRNQSENVYMTNQKQNIGGETFTGGSTQIWRFQRQSNGAYSIVSVDDNSCVDVQGVSTENGANVYAYNGGYAGGANQQFYIYKAYGAYYLSPVHMKGSHMLDMSLTTHNLEMWGVGADWAPQEFDIEKVTFIVKYDANGGNNAPSAQTKTYKQNLTLRSGEPVRGGYAFLGWASDPNAETPEYSPGALYTADKEITLYAVWERSAKLIEIKLPESNTVEYGNTLTYQVTYVPEDTTDDKTVAWSSSNTGIFTVSNAGVVTPTGIGTATLTAKVGDHTATSSVTVKKGTPKYSKPGEVNATCGQTLSEIVLPAGFKWNTPGQSVGSAGTKSFNATFTPDDTAHYDSVGDISVTVNVSHAFADKWTAGTDTHWHECVCGTKGDEANHTYGSWKVTKEATCTAEGGLQRTCTVCGKKEQEAIDAKGHVWNKEYTVDKEATTAEEGSKSIHCSVCDAVKPGSEVPIPKLTIQLGKTSRGDMFNLANNVKVTWKEVPGAKYYKVYRKGITDPSESLNEPVIVTERLIGWDQQPGLTNGHAYRYTIVASMTSKGDPSGDSKLSYSKLMYRLKTVVIRSVKNTAPGKVTVKYDKTTSGDSYVLQYCEREDMVGAKTKVVLGANNTSYVIGGLKKGKTYYISIRVRKKVDGIDYYTTFGVPKKVTIVK